MIKQIKSSDIKKFIQDNPNTVLLDVRTEEEWNTVGKPETKDLGIKSYFITISQDPSFLENIKKEIEELRIKEYHEDELQRFFKAGRCVLR